MEYFVRSSEYYSAGLRYLQFSPLSDVKYWQGKEKSVAKAKDDSPLEEFGG